MSKDIGAIQQIDSDREYAISKGEVLKRFTEFFHQRYKHSALYNGVLEMLIRDYDPYAIIEKVIEINDELYRRLEDEISRNNPIPKINPNNHE